MEPQTVATLVSVLALVLSATALGWNIYRDVVLRARVKVRVAVVQLIGGAGVARKLDERINISATNMGPGPVQIIGIAGLIAPWHRRLLRRPQHFVVLQDSTYPLGDKLPKRIDVGETIDIYLPHEARSFLAGDATHIGVRDSFGRQHYASRVGLRHAKKTHQKDFGSDRGRTAAE